MTIITRASKGSALTHVELDGNFTDLDGRVTTLQTDVASLPDVTDGTVNLDVSKIIINATESGTDPRIQSQGSQYDSVRFMRAGQTGASARSTGLFVTEYTDAGHTAGQGTGYWTRIKTTDKESHGGAVLTTFESVTDSNNWTATLEFRPVKSTGGSEDFNTSVLTVSQDKVEVKNTQDFIVGSGIGLWLKPTAYANLPANTGSADDGKVAFLTNDGAGTPQYKLIISVGGAWKYVQDNTTVAAS
mgnify:CR=1 FL=1